MTLNWPNCTLAGATAYSFAADSQTAAEARKLTAGTNKQRDEQAIRTREKRGKTQTATLFSVNKT